MDLTFISSRGLQAGLSLYFHRPRQPYLRDPCPINLTILGKWRVFRFNSIQDLPISFRLTVREDTSGCGQVRCKLWKYLTRHSVVGFSFVLFSMLVPYQFPLFAQPGPFSLIRSYLIILLTCVTRFASFLSISSVFPVVETKIA